jgi:hypothetical protein
MDPSMNDFGAEPHKMPRSAHPAHWRHSRNPTKAHVGRAEMALHRYRARAAAILHAEGLRAEREPPHSTYVFKIVRHRETGVRVRVLDTLADDAPPQEGKDVVHQYVVECQTHGRTGPSFASARAAMVAARRPEQWCTQCADLVRAQADTRRRTRAAGREPRPGGDARP